MLPCKKVLCPTDFSEASYGALKVANELAAQFSAELLLLHVRPLTNLPPDVLEVSGFDLAKYDEQWAEASRKELDGVAKTRVPKQVKRRTLMKQGDAGHEIIQTAEEEGTDLIVIATHGMTGWRHYLYGSVAQRVIQHAPCSVLIVRTAGSK